MNLRLFKGNIHILSYMEDSEPYGERDIYALDVHIFRFHMRLNFWIA